MKPLVLARTDQLTEEEFRAIRRNFIGASDAAAIVGANKFSSALQVYMEKKGLAEEKVETEAMYWGKALEDMVAREFAFRNAPVKVTKMNTILANPNRDFIAATPDRKVTWKGKMFGEFTSPGVLECKTALSPYAQKYWDNTETGIPSMYIIQVQQQLYVTGWDVGFLAVLMSGPQYRDYIIPRDERLIASMVALEIEFWHLVEQGIPPSHDGASLDMAKALYPTAEQKRAIYGEVGDIFALAAMKRLSSALEKAIDNLQARIIMETKDADTILVPGIEDPVATYKEVTSERWDTKALEADHPELVPQYKKPSTTRRFSPQYKVLEQHPALMAAAQALLTASVPLIETKE